jgi:hypothetical protein
MALPDVVGMIQSTVSMNRKKGGRKRSYNFLPACLKKTAVSSYPEIGIYATTSPAGS